MGRRKYANISIPKSLAEEIDQYILKSKLGYKSRAELVTEAIREKITE